MKVAFISRNTLFTGRGGDTVQIVKTAKYLKDLGVEVDIFTSAETIDYDKYDIMHGFNVIRPADLILHFQKFKGLKVLSTIFVDYSEYDSYGRGGVAGKVFKLIGNDKAEYLKAVMRRIKSGERSINAGYLLKGHRASLKKLVELSDLLLPNSKNEYERLASKYTLSKAYKVIPNAIDTEIFRFDYDITNKQKNLVICVARIDGIKSQLNLIRALRDTEFELIIIGKPAPNQPEYYRLCREEATSNISFIEEMPQEDLIGYYKKAKVHAMPSWFETTGLSSLEAVAMGCNIVISDKGDTLEYFSGNAFYCEPDNIKSIYKAVSNAANAPFNAVFREKVYKDYNWQQTAEKTLEAYKTLLQK